VQLLILGKMQSLDRSKAYLHSIAGVVGDPVPIASIEPIARDPDLLDLLHAGGLRDYRRAEMDPPKLAAAAMRGSIERSGLDPRQIDAVVWSSTSFQRRAWYTEDISRVLGSLGLWTAVPFGVTLSECGNLSAALRVGEGLHASGYSNVMIVVADRCQGAEQRLVSPALAVLSDGAASCIVSSERRGFELMSISQYTNHRARQAPGEESLRLLRHNAEGMRRATTAALSKAQLAPDAISTMITNNLSRPLLETFATQAGVPFSRVYTERIATHGHVYAADCLLNLADYPHTAGGAVLLATNGTCTWGAAVLCACEAAG
jgi:3-oxoacyl-[acyl-carrier-protein] synthase III